MEFFAVKTETRSFKPHQFNNSLDRYSEFGMHKRLAGMIDE